MWVEGRGGATRKLDWLAAPGRAGLDVSVVCFGSDIAQDRVKREGGAAAGPDDTAAAV